ncbi:MAG: long-chain-fatty-acid--CoA ligase [Acidobacteria bacterium]|nr:long-chain-fatty-acid--CoA ligase [Acidobacteriota bacterium]
MILTQVLKRGAAFYPHHIATIDGEHRQTYQEMRNRVTAFAAALQQRGVKQGDRIAILMLNGHEFAEVIFACWDIGAVVVPLNYRLAAEELIFIINDAECVAMISDDVMLPMTVAMRPRLEGIQHYIATAPAENFLGYEDLIANATASVVTPEIAENDLAGLFYTSGTTGLPKGVMLSHRNLWMNLLHSLAAIPAREGEVYMHAAPMFHLADFPSLMSITLHGNTHVMLKKFDPAGLLELIERERVTSVTLVPTMINFIINHPDVHRRDLSSLTRIGYGASPMPAELLKRTMQTLPGVELSQGYGQSESSPLLTRLSPQDHVLEGPEHLTRRLASCGRPIIGVELQIFDDSDQPVKQGEVGEIVARGPNVMLGYWKRPEETARTLRGGWLHTGDAARMDEHGFFYIVDRTKDMIVTGGENVYSTEVENVLFKHPAVREVAVIGTPDEKWGEVVAAVVTLKSGVIATAEELISHCAEHLAHYKTPKLIEIRDSELPKGGTGKIDKKVLREPYWKGYARRVN